MLAWLAWLASERESMCALIKAWCTAGPRKDGGRWGARGRLRRCPHPGLLPSWNPGWHSHRIHIPWIFQCLSNDM